MLRWRLERRLSEVYYNFSSVSSIEFLHPVHTGLTLFFVDILAFCLWKLEAQRAGY
jgi:hypothetical protein